MKTGRGRSGLIAIYLCCTTGMAWAQTDWPSFGHDPGAMRYSPLKQIDTGNVTQLRLAWQFDTLMPDAHPPVAPIVAHGGSGSSGVGFERRAARRRARNAPDETRPVE